MSTWVPMNKPYLYIYIYKHFGEQIKILEIFCEGPSKMAHYQKQKLSFNMHLQLTIIVDCKYVYSPRVYDTYTYTYLAKNIYFVRPSK
jgi:hypothetical protein